jgi:hypothetical protein
MSPSKFNSLLTGVIIAMCVAISGSVMAQDGLRLWKPYDSQSFGGGRRSNDGMYSSLTGIYWSISTPKGGYIGATTANGEDDVRWVFDQGGNYAQTNSIKIEMMNPTTTLGTRFEVGNRRGHHGWLASGYGLPGQSHSMSVQNASVTIRDEGNFDYDIGIATLPNYIYVWNRLTNSPSQEEEPRLVTEMFPFVTGLGYLWGLFTYLGGPDGTGVGLFAPMPIIFEYVDINVKSSHYSGELMYTYRPHPYTWGSMELLAGARYWEFNDSFGFRGANWLGVPPVVSQIEPRTGLTSMFIDADAKNYVFGPQVGMKLSRHNARWTFGAEGKITAGINAQTVSTQGSLQPRITPIDDGVLGGLRGPVGLQNNNYNFGHKQTKAYFSPIGELRLTADFQLTSAVSVFGAVDGMAADNIARGVRVTDYVVKSDGTIFGIRGNDRNATVAVYGVEAGVKVNR